MHGLFNNEAKMFVIHSRWGESVGPQACARRGQPSSTEAGGPPHAGWGARGVGMRPGSTASDQ